MSPRYFLGNTATNFADHVRDDRLRAQLQAGASIAMPADAIAAAIAYATAQPEAVDIGEIVIRPNAQAGHSQDHGLYAGIGKISEGSGVFGPSRASYLLATRFLEP